MRGYLSLFIITYMKLIFSVRIATFAGRQFTAAEYLQLARLPVPSFTLGGRAEWLALLTHRGRRRKRLRCLIALRVSS